LLSVKALIAQISFFFFFFFFLQSLYWAPSFSMGTDGHTTKTGNKKEMSLLSKFKEDSSASSGGRA